jgi:hypothetical protein
MAVWRKSWECGHEWQAAPAEREKGQRLRCPECRTILDSPAYHFPEIADEWSPENPPFGVLERVTPGPIAPPAERGRKSERQRCFSACSSSSHRL